MISEKCFFSGIVIDIIQSVWWGWAFGVCQRAKAVTVPCGTWLLVSF